MQMPPVRPANARFQFDCSHPNQPSTIPGSGRVSGNWIGFEMVHIPNCCTTLLVELPSPTHAQAVEFKRILPVPNRRGSPLFFENREQKRIEPTRKRPSIQMTRSRVAQAELAGSPRGLGKAHK